MITLKCPGCEQVNRSVMADVEATFKAGVVGVPYYGRVELGILTRVIASGLVISLGQLQCPSCRDVFPMERWQVSVVCECGAPLVILSEAMQDPILEGTFCKNHNMHLCKSCWENAGCRRCENRGTCEVRGYYE